MKSIKLEITKQVLEAFLDAGHPLEKAVKIIRKPIMVSVQLIELEDDKGIIVDRIFGYEEQ